ncbi:MAG: hypothetical protein JXR76_10870 [Deltaproteobacteria bacterium]|nr:hypothetical protein [Deltaproteobacteria bacterium]
MKLHYSSTARALSLILATGLLLLALTFVTAAQCDTKIIDRRGWYLDGAVGAIQFLHPQRNSAAISNYTTGGVLSLEIYQRPLQHLGIGVRGALLGVPSNEPDARATYGGRAIVSMKFFFEAGKLEMYGAAETGYTLLHRKVNFENADKIQFHGATMGLALGGQRQINQRITMGFVVRFSQMISSISCTEHLCHSPRKGRNPGPALFVGLHSNYKL